MYARFDAISRPTPPPVHIYAMQMQRDDLSYESQNQLIYLEPEIVPATPGGVLDLTSSLERSA